MSQKIIIYPGTFDPLTFGHLNIIERASSLCDQLVVGVAQNSGKSPIFSLDERLFPLSRQMQAYHGVRGATRAQDRGVHDGQTPRSDDMN